MFNAANDTHFSLTIEGVEHDLQVLAFTGCEAISQAYRFDLELISERPDWDLQSLLHRPAFLTFSPAGNGIHGLIHRVAQGESGKRLTRYRLTIVPQLAYLAHRTDQRIFQHLSVPQIIVQVLEGHGIQANAYRFQLGPLVYPERNYCVQYSETDLHFVQRLCEEEGIHYHFEHSERGHVLVFGDDQTSFPKLGQPTAYLQDSGLIADEPVIKRFAVRLETRTNRVSRRDYDFEQPRLVMEAGHKGSEQQSASGSELEDYDYPGRFTDRTRGKHLSQRALERHRFDYRRAEGRSDQSTLASGHLLEISDHPRREWNDLWLLTEVFHEGKQPQVLEESIANSSNQHGHTHTTQPEEGLSSTENRFTQGYRNRFFATPWDVPFRPALSHPKPRVLGAQTAVVTGPAGEEIHCDEYGRIKVQFFWDRDGQADDKTSCWLRVSNSWAGDGYGGIAIPRVGMEVLVTFLEADPDRPLVTGCLYHAEHQVPYDLPANKTRSVFKTLSSPGGSGYNELRIEDRKGAEQIYIHAQRDWDENVQHDQKIRVGHERHDTVEANSFTELHAEEHLIVRTDRKVEIKPDDHLTIGQTQHIKLGTAQLAKAGREIHLKSGQKMVIEAGIELTLHAGGSFIKLDPSGITISGPLVKINAGGALGKGSGTKIKPPVLPGAAEKDEAGDVLKQAAGNLAASEPTSELGNRLRVQLKRPFEKEGIAGQPYVLNVDGIEHRGTTAEGGYVDQPLPDGAKKATMTFYPFGPEHQTWTWELDINKQAPANDVLGRQSRLKNLGFYSGVLDGIDGPKTQYAIRCFQRACQLADKDHLTASEQNLLIKQHNV
ncbi:type IV secretion protein Rhs [Stutzerimonas stutzeri]|uniref:Type IV secretion protein Rhs n=1 Tax=Stutzerimonas stutzeri TaxID=316 RepID=W8RQ15_STUST|nr:type VI secretion system tip protein TssI/VgrG [Stutzerimonas stutzeri]AHL74116.1 type IV secretion protein Rhs [Stutzerimonas stutzeri]MCQ4331754.1 type VI secretion system tip protein VgrG [Stutzerimonas stutzeri]